MVADHRPDGVDVTIIINPKALADSLGKQFFDMTPGEAKSKGLCIRCKQPPDFDYCKSPSDRALSIREFGISAICPKCWDELFKEPDDEDDMPGFEDDIGLKGDLDDDERMDMTPGDHL